jgi:nicotinate dehydrogenase subunit B
MSTPTCESATMGWVTCYVGEIEMGQGNMTALGQLVAEELSVALTSVDMVMGDTERCPWDLGTFGSMSVAVFGPVLRRAAADTREVFRELAAERLQVPVTSLDVGNGSVFDTRQPDRTLTYAALAHGQAITRHVSVAPTPKKPSTLSVIGQSAPRFDAIDKITGRAHYAGDIRLPGMLYAAILRPAHGATMIGLDIAAVARIHGAHIVRDRDLVAVLHEHPDEAARACALITAEFDQGAPALDDNTIFEHLIRAAPAGRTVVQTGIVQEGERLAAAVFDQTYRNAYVAHAAMETHSALAMFDNGKVTVGWEATMNAIWHQRHTMPKNSSLEKRMRWHLAPAKACACRGIPRLMVAEMRRRGVPKFGTGRQPSDPGLGNILKQSPSMRPEVV